MEQTRYLLEKAKRDPELSSPVAAGEAPVTPKRVAPTGSEGTPPNVHAEPSAPLPPTQDEAERETEPATPSETEQEKVYSRLLAQLRRCAEDGSSSEAA